MRGLRRQKKSSTRGLYNVITAIAINGEPISSVPREAEDVRSKPRIQPDPNEIDRLFQELYIANCDSNNPPSVRCEVQESKLLSIDDKNKLNVGEAKTLPPESHSQILLPPLVCDRKKVCKHEPVMGQVLLMITLLTREFNSAQVNELINILMGQESSLQLQSLNLSTIIQNVATRVRDVIWLLPQCDPDQAREVLTNCFASIRDLVDFGKARFRWSSNHPKMTWFICDFMKSIRTQYVSPKHMKIYEECLWTFVSHSQIIRVAEPLIRRTAFRRLCDFGLDPLLLYGINTWAVGRVVEEMKTLVNFELSPGFFERLRLRLHQAIVDRIPTRELLAFVDREIRPRFQRLSDLSLSLTSFTAPLQVLKCQKSCQLLHNVDCEVKNYSNPQLNTKSVLTFTVLEDLLYKLAKYPRANLTKTADSRIQRNLSSFMAKLKLAESRFTSSLKSTLVKQSEVAEEFANNLDGSMPSELKAMLLLGMTIDLPTADPTTEIISKVIGQLHGKMRQHKFQFAEFNWALKKEMKHKPSFDECCDILQQLCLTKVTDAGGLEYGGENQRSNPCTRFRAPLLKILTHAEPTFRSSKIKPLVLAAELFYSPESVKDPKKLWHIVKYFHVSGAKKSIWSSRKAARPILKPFLDKVLYPRDYFNLCEEASKVGSARVVRFGRMLVLAEFLPRFLELNESLGSPFPSDSDFIKTLQQLNHEESGFTLSHLRSVLKRIVALKENCFREQTVRPDVSAVQLRGAMYDSSLKSLIQRLPAFLILRQLYSEFAQECAAVLNMDISN